MPRKQKGKVNLRNYEFHVYKIGLKTKPSREILERELPGTGIDGRRAGIRLKILARWAVEKKRTIELRNSPFHICEWLGICGSKLFFF